jgi:hypothetical protein
MAGNVKEWVWNEQAGTGRATSRWTIRTINFIGFPAAFTTGPTRTGFAAAAAATAPRPPCRAAGS